MLFSNPRTTATFATWPLGGNKRGMCKFWCETSKRGTRVLRQTTGKAKAHTYGGLAAIVDGDDGKTYILQHNTYSDSISVSQSDFMNANVLTNGRGDKTNSVWKEDEAYNILAALISKANEPERGPMGIFEGYGDHDPNA